MISARRSLLLSLLAFALLAIVVAVLFARSDALTHRLAINSLILAAGATAVALPLGTALATALSRTDVWGRSGATVLLGTLLFLPLYVQLSGWDAVGGKNGWYTLAYGAVDRPLLSGMAAAIWIHALAAAPWVTLIVGVGLRLVEPELEEAALLDASPSIVLMRVTLPQTLPFLFAAGVWTFVGTTSEMTVTNIYLVSTYTEEFYMSLAQSPDASEAAVQVLPGMATVALLVVATIATIAWLSPKLPRSSPRRSMVYRLGKTRAAVSVPVWLTTLALVCVPLVSLCYKAGVQMQMVDSVPLRHWSLAKFSTVVAGAPWHFRNEFQWTAVIAIAAATVTMAVAIILGWLARFGRWRAVPATVALALCVAVPGPLVAIAIIGLLNRPGALAEWLYDDTIAAPLLAQMVRAIPVALLIVWQAFRSISDETLDAAALDGAGPVATLFRIAIPQRKAAIFAAWLAAFAVSAGDVGYSLLVIPPGMDTIQRRIFGLVHSGVEEQVAGVSLVMIMAYFLIAAAVLGLLRRDRS